MDQITHINKVVLDRLIRGLNIFVCARLPKLAEITSREVAMFTAQRKNKIKLI